MSERVAIVGSRYGADLAAVDRYVDSLRDGTVVVSGGALGVDRRAETRALDRGFKVSIHFPWYELDGAKAPFIRNAEIVKDCTRLVAFIRKGGSRGTSHVVNLARKAGKPVEVFEARD